MARPRLPPGSVRMGQLAVAPAQANSLAGSTCPNGLSKLWSLPAPMPSLETEKFCTLSSWATRVPPVLLIAMVGLRGSKKLIGGELPYSLWTGGCGSALSGIGHKASTVTACQLGVQRRRCFASREARDRSMPATQPRSRLHPAAITSKRNDSLLVKLPANARTPAPTRPNPSASELLDDLHAPSRVVGADRLPGNRPGDRGTARDQTRPRHGTAASLVPTAEAPGG